MDLFFSSSASSSFLYSSYSNINHRPRDYPLGRSVWRCARDCWLQCRLLNRNWLERQTALLMQITQRLKNTKHLEQRVRASTPCECFQDNKFLFVATTKHYPCATNAFHVGIIAWSVDNTSDLVKGTCITEVQCKYDQASFCLHTTQTTRGNHPYSKYCQSLNNCRYWASDLTVSRVCRGENMFWNLLNI